MMGFSVVSAGLSGVAVVIAGLVCYGLPKTGGKSLELIESELYGGD